MLFCLQDCKICMCLFTRMIELFMMCNRIFFALASLQLSKFLAHTKNLARMENFPQNTILK